MSPVSSFYFRNIRTKLDLNGPQILFTSQPVGVATTTGGTATFIGIATVTFANLDDPSNSGTIKYQWFEGDVALSDSDNISGTGSTTLTIGLEDPFESPRDNNTQYKLSASYIPSNQTGNSIQENVFSDSGTLTIFPNLEIISEPSNRSVAPNENASFNILASLSDTTFGAGNASISYQWYIDGSPATDGNIVVQQQTYNTVTRTVSYYNSRGPGNYTESIPSSARNIIISLAGAEGGRGGDDANGPGGSGGQGRGGRFSYRNAGRTLSFRIGGRGSNGSTGTSSGGGSGGSGSVSGGRGGNAGPSGWSGGGGGGGGASYVSDNRSGLTIISAGGGGGGGGSFNRAGGNAANVVPGVGQGYARGSKGLRGGSNGANAGGDGGGGGGGGGGASGSGGFGGNSGADNSVNSTQGAGGVSYSDNSVVSRIGDGWLHNGSGYYTLSYEYDSTTTVPVGRTIITRVTGSQTNSLQLSCNDITSHEIYCLVNTSLSESTIKSVKSDTVYFSSSNTPLSSVVNIETYALDGTVTTNNDILSNGDETIQRVSSSSSSPYLYCVYAPQSNVDIEMDLFGGKGNNSGGGQGGFSRIKFTLQRGVEYIIAGLTDDVNTPFIYEKASLIACVGAGGDADGSNSGGDGGGCLLDGQGGVGNRTRGGEVFTPSLNGRFGSSVITDVEKLDGPWYEYRYIPPSNFIKYNEDEIGDSGQGGRTISCTKGIYWKEQGLSSCQDISSSSKFRLSNGTELSNSATLSRGYKSGYNIIQTGSNAYDNPPAGVTPQQISQSARGGAGLEGGQSSTTGGGAGGSGWADTGKVEIVDASQGGSSGSAKVVIRLSQ